MFYRDMEPPGSVGVTYAWAVLEGIGDPAAAATEDFQTTLKSDGTIRVKLALTIGATTGEKVRAIVAARPEVTRLGWRHDLDMTKWPNGGAIEDPVWVKPLGGGVMKNEPVAPSRSGIPRRS